MLLQMRCRYSPIDDFVASPSLQHGVTFQSFPQESTAQHFPLMCDFSNAAACRCEHRFDDLLAHGNSMVASQWQVPLSFRFMNH